MIPSDKNLNIKEYQGKIVQGLTRIDTICSKASKTEAEITELKQIYYDTISWLDENFAELEIDIISQLTEFMIYYYDVSS